MLTAAGLTRSFGARVAVENVSFELAPGEIFALLGPNGAGKTTTLRMLAGLIEPSSGAVSVDGETVTRPTLARLRARVGFLTEVPGLWDRLTVRQNLLVYARLHGLDAPEGAVDASLEFLGIRSRADDRAAELSKGLKQRVAIARTLLHNPDILLLDEPTAGLDPESARDVRQLVLRLRQQGRTVVVSTHNLDEAERIADRVAVLRKSLVAIDSPSALRARLFDTRVRIVLNGPAEPFASAVKGAGADDVRVEGSTISVGVGSSAVTTPALVRTLVEAGAAIESVIREEPALEEVYLRLLERSGSHA